MTMRGARKAAENGLDGACSYIASNMYIDAPYAREVGHVEEAAAAATSFGVIEGHDVPPEVLMSVIYWLEKGGHNTVGVPLPFTQTSAVGGCTLRQRRVRGFGPAEGLQSLPAVQDRPVLRRRMSESRLDRGWTQDDVWDTRAINTVTTAPVRAQQGMLKGDAGTAVATPGLDGGNNAH
jgi:hypothetical protein